MSKTAKGLVMFQCSGCKEKIKDYWNVCPYCGVVLEPTNELKKKRTLYCACCRHRVKPDWKYCATCGSKVNKK